MYPARQVDTWLQTLPMMDAHPVAQKPPPCLLALNTETRVRPIVYQVDLFSMRGEQAALTAQPLTSLVE